MPNDLTRPTILVIDDNEPLLLACARALHRAGCTVLLAHDGATAIEQLRIVRGSVDLLIVDLGLPDLSGRELVKRAGIDAPVLYITGTDVDGGSGTPRRSLIGQILLKPFRLEALTERVSALLDLDGDPDPTMAPAA